MSTTTKTTLPSQKLTEITVWLSSDCDLRCKYCFVYKLNENQPTGKMTKETADQLIRFAEKNLNQNGSIWFFGGEPFCCFDIMQYIVEKCKSLNLKIRFGATTNATLLTEERVRWMKKSNFNILCSIDGPKESHNQNRVYPNGEGSWDDAWRGLGHVRQFLNPTPQIRWTVTPSNVKGLAGNIRAFVEEHKLTNMPIDMVYELEWTNQDLATLKKELEIFREDYKRWMEQGISVFSMFIRDANSAVSNHTRCWSSRCGLGNGSIGVDYDGTIYPCHRLIDSHQINIGNIYDGFNPKRLEWMENWRRTAPYCEVPKKCLDCNFKNACTGGCPAMNYDVFGNPHVSPEAFCSIKQLITEVLGDLCKSLQNNSAFQKLYNKKTQTQAPTRQTPLTNKEGGAKNGQ